MPRIINRTDNRGEINIDLWNTYIESILSIEFLKLYTVISIEFS